MSISELYKDNVKITSGNPVAIHHDPGCPAPMFYHDPDGPIIIKSEYNGAGASPVYTSVYQLPKLEVIPKNLATTALHSALMCSITGTAPQVAFLVLSASSESGLLLCGIFGSNKPDVKHQDQVASLSGPQLCTIKPSPCPWDKPSMCGFAGNGTQPIQCGIAGSFGPIVKKEVKLALDRFVS